MVQLSFMIHGIDQGAAPPLDEGPLRLDARQGGVRVTGVWRAPLARARRELAAYLARLPASARVTDLLLGLEQRAPEAVARLSAPPSAARCLLARHCELEGTRWIRLFGLYQLGRSDVVAAVAPDVDLDQAYRLLTRLGEAHLRHEGQPPTPPDQPFAYGYWLLAEGSAALADDAFWSALKVGLGSEHLAAAFDARMVTPAPRLLLEAEDVTWAEPERWLIGISHAVRTFSAQERTRARLDVSRLGGAPNALDAAMVCARLDGADSFFAYREAPVDPRDSGWRFACLDPTHHHDEAASRFAVLNHLTARFPELVQYLGLPPGWILTREEGAWWLTAPGGERSLLDVGAEPGAPWDAPRGQRP